MKMFKKFLFLGFLLLSITALSRAQEVAEVTAEAAAAAGAVAGDEETTTPEPPITVEGDVAETAAPDADADVAEKDDKKVKGKSGGGVVSEILEFMQKTCDKIIKFIKGKSDEEPEADTAAAKTADAAGNDTAAESTPADDALTKAGKKAQKVLDKVSKKHKKAKEPEVSDEETTEEEE